MSSNARPAWEESLSDDEYRSLSNTQRRVSEGSDQVLVNPAYADKSDEEIKDSVWDILFDTDKELTTRLQELEGEQASKFGPRSIAIPWEERRSSLLDYFNKDDFDPGELAELDGPHTLRPVGKDAVAKRLIKSSSAGLPYMRQKGAVMDNALSSWSEEVGVYPCVLYTRTAEEKKTRNVWGYPISDTIWEQEIEIPFLEQEKKFPFRAALIGPSAVDRSITWILDRVDSDHMIVCVDFSAYDASIRSELTYGAFSFIASFFQPQISQEIYQLYRRFLTIPIFTPDGEKSGPHGVPSGSAFTNSVDSIIQFGVAGHLSDDFQVQGDDGVYLVRKSDLDTFHSLFAEAGLTLNEDKTEMFESEEALYLQRYYNPLYKGEGGEYGGVYPIFRAMNRIKYLERFTNLEELGIEGSDFFSLRTIMILENCKYHPCFLELVMLAQSLDKYGLKYSRQSVSAYSKSTESRARAGLFDTEDFASGFDSFETVKILNSL